MPSIMHATAPYPRATSWGCRWPTVGPTFTLDTPERGSTDSPRRRGKLGGGLPATFVFDLAVHPRDTVVVVATCGRGMWVSDAAAVQKARQAQ